METTPEMIIGHVLPGRLRMRLSLPPKNTETLVAVIKRHPGLLAVVYTPVTAGLLVTFDPSQVSAEEVILRTGLAWNNDHHFSSFRLRWEKRNVALGDLSIYAGLMILVCHGLALRYPASRKLETLNLLTGVATLAAVVDHSFDDLKEKGRLHPEVISLTYLAASFLRKTILKGATVTWFMTFARHLVEAPSGALIVTTGEVPEECRIEEPCERTVTVAREEEEGSIGGWLRALPRITFAAYREMNLSLEDSLLQQIHGVGKSHDDVIEGLENLKRGILLKVEV